MPHSPMSLPHDPLGALGQPAVISGTETPVPLVGTSFAVKIDGGLALVTMIRRFRNAEAHSIEVTMTFPVPVHATLFDLAAQIGERLLRARAQSQRQARDTYEDAIDRGRTAVLHEEVLRGVHQLSVGHVPPGAEIAVEATWAMPLSAVPGGGVLHIPVTVGDIYGRSPLPDSDDLFHSPEVQEADLWVDCPEGMLMLAGGTLSQGRAKLRLDAPIRLTVTGWRSRMLRGVAADGRGVGIEIAPAALGSLPLDAAVLVDRSGSMNQGARGLPPAGQLALAHRTTHEVVVAGLLEAAAAVGPQDRIDLWEFNNAANPVLGDGFADAVARLASPTGGTETGGAIRSVLAGRTTRDVLLVTDGKSHALDIQAAANSGRRFQVVLIGDDSLEARVGHLAALTGGQIFIAAGLEAGGMIQRAIEAMRLPHAVAVPIMAAPAAAEALLGGMQVKATWWGRAEADPGPWSRAVAAVATALALPRMSAEAATALAAAEGLVCHLTSLVLVDEAGEAQGGLPGQRRVGTMRPRTLAVRSGITDMPDLGQVSHLMAEPPQGSRSVSRQAPAVVRSAPLASRSTPVGSGLDAWLGLVDWSVDPEGLRRGDLAALAPDVAEAVRAASARSEVMSLATLLGVQPIVVVLALLADAESKVNRGAARFARAVLGTPAASSFGHAATRKAPSEAVAAAAKAVGL